MFLFDVVDFRISNIVIFIIEILKFKIIDLQNALKKNLTIILSISKKTQKNDTNFLKLTLIKKTIKQLR